jgi:hypothetical protein
MPKINAAAPTAAQPGDTSLPDPSNAARAWLFFGVIIAIAAAIVMNLAGLTAKDFTPPKGDFNFAVFAGFYAAAQIIERLMELVTPLLPVDFSSIAAGDNAARAAQAKADRAKEALAVASVAGVVAASAFGLFFLKTIGITTSHTVDALCTGLVIAAGTKPLHDFISLLQNQNAPKTQTEV